MNIIDEAFNNSDKPLIEPIINKTDIQTNIESPDYAGKGYDIAKELSNKELTPAIYTRTPLEFMKTLTSKGVIEFSKSNLPIRDKFDYTKARENNINDTDIINYLASIDTKFDYTKAREDFGDTALVNSLKVNSEANQYNEQKARFDKMGDFGKGVAKVSLGINALASDILNGIGIIPDEVHNDTLTKITKVNKALEGARDDKDFFSSYTLGNITGEILTLPSTETKVGIMAVGTTLGYARARGEGNNKTYSIAMGAGEGLLGVGVAKIFEKLSIPAHKNTYNYYRNELNLNSTEADTIYKDWSYINESTGNIYADKLQAIIDASGNFGARLKEDLGYKDPEVQSMFFKAKSDRYKLLKDLSESADDIVSTSDKLTHNFNLIKDNYGIAKNHIMSNNTDEIIDLSITDLPLKLDNIKDDRKIVKDLLGFKKAKNEDVTRKVSIADLIDVMPHLNSIIAKSKGKQKHEWSSIANMVKTELKANLDEPNFKLWEDVNNDYAIMHSILEDNIGKAIVRVTQPLKGKGGKTKQIITEAKGMKLIKSASESGRPTFIDLSHLVGKATMQNFELHIINKALKGSIDKHSLNMLTDSLDTKGFTSLNGKYLADTIQHMAKVFRTDDAVRQLVTKESSLAGNRYSSDIHNVLNMFIVGKLFKTMLKSVSPISKVGKELVMRDDLVKAFKRPTISKIRLHTHSLNDDTRSELLNSIIKDPTTSDELQTAIETYYK